MYRNTCDKNNLPGNFKCYKEIGHELKDFYPEHYTVLSLKTLGQSPQTAEIIEIAALYFSDNVLVDSYVALVKPSKPVPLELTRCTGIDNEMLETAEDLPAALLRLRGFLGDSFILGYDIGFEVELLHAKMLEYLNTGFGNWYVEVKNLARANLEALEPYREPDVCKALRLPVKGPQRAQASCRLCNSIYQRLKEMHIEGYKEPLPRKALVITEEGLERAPFFNKNFYFLGTMEYSTSYELANAVIGLGAIEIDDDFYEHTDFVVVGFAEGSALEAESLKLALLRKDMLGSPVIMKEEKFLYGLRKKGYVK